jgi:hypothetical protein
VTRPHVRYGWRVRRMAVCCTCSRLSMYRHVHRQFMRNTLHNFTTIVPVTVYHQGSYVETYSRFMAHVTLSDDNASNPNLCGSRQIVPVYMSTLTRMDTVWDRWEGRE